MLTIEDKSSKGWKELVELCLKSVLSVIPGEDLEGVKELLILDECPDKKFKWAGGFYNAAHDSMPASIELYPPKILEAQPFFVPKIIFFNKYSIIKMFLHELGHHKYGILDISTREKKADEYLLTYLTKLYGRWVYFFDFLGTIDRLIRKP